jgi:hypothetical protein
MFQPIDVATTISRWTDYGVTLRKALADAVAAFDAVSAVEVGHQATIDLAKITSPATAEKEIRKLADAMILTTPVGGGVAPVSVLQGAKTHARQVAARNVIVQARAAVPDAVEQLTPHFTEAAEAYVEAVSALPAEITAEELVRAGGPVVQAYGEAKAAAAVLGSVDAWVASLSQLQGIAGEADPVLRLLRPEAPAQLARLDEAYQGRHDGAVSALGPAWLAAARLGVPFAINTPAEARKLRSSLSTVVRVAS